MYIPEYFSITGNTELGNFIDAWSFGTLITTNNGRISANEIPFLLARDENRLYAHLARPNHHWKELETADDVLVTFKGPNAYISPNWYQSKQMVPTWNYTAVHVRGKASLMDTTDQLVNLLTLLSAKHENRFETPWTMDKLDTGLKDKLLTAIVGFWIDIESIEGKAKLSQNRSAEDIAGAVEGLKSGNSQMENEVAERMEESK